MLKYAICFLCILTFLFLSTYGGLCKHRRHIELFFSLWEVGGHGKIHSVGTLYVGMLLGPRLVVSSQQKMQVADLFILLELHFVDIMSLDLKTYDSCLLFSPWILFCSS